MNITPLNYVNYNQYNYCRNANKSNPAFGSIHFSDNARKAITDHLFVADTTTRNRVMHSLEKIIKEGANTRDILVDAPGFVTGLIAKVSASNPGRKEYGLKTFIQSKVYDTKFLEDALEEAKKPIQKK